MKFIKLYLLFFVSFSIFSQSGEILYEAEMLPIDYEKKLDNDTIPEKHKANLRALYKTQLKVMYKLIFNKTESFFEKQKSMGVEKRTLNFAESKMGKGVYYTNKKEKKIINQKEYAGQEFLVAIPPFQWNLTQEKKQIGNYICYRATTIRYVEGRNGKMERKVIAWYTLEIPYNFGPKDYNGLPGLILELQEENLLIKAFKINIKPKTQKNIKKPNQGEKIILKEYDSIVKEIYYKRRRRN
jgi:GLPGLI family protein